MKPPLSMRHLRSLFILLGLALAARQWAWMPVLVLGPSMQPTLQGGQLLGVNKLAYRFEEPRRGDIVEVWNGSSLMLKRILGLPGETIALRQGTFEVDGIPLVEPYVEFHDLGNIGPGRLGSDCYLVAGDNRPQTLIAVVHRDRIVGRVMGQSFRHPGRYLAKLEKPVS